MRVIIALLLVSAAAVALAGDAPVHMTAGVPASLQEEEHEQEVEQPRFAQSEGESDSESEGESSKDRDWDWENLKETSRVDNWVTRSVDKTIPGYKPKLNSEYQTISEQQFYKLGRETDRAMAEPDTVMEESTDTFKQSARCLMFCANSVGLCTRGNKKGCACAAGCQCNRGEASATCCQHCHPANPVMFVYGYHDTAHLAPHIWSKSVGETVENYGLVRECLAGCAHRGKCKPRFCPRHPKGGYKCDQCKRMALLPRSGKPTSKYVKYSCGSKPKPKPKRRRQPRVRLTHHSHHDVMDSWGHVSHHHHHHTIERLPAYRFQQQHDEAESDSDSDSDVVEQGDLETEDSDEDHIEVHMTDDAPLVAEAEVAEQDQQQDEALQSAGPALLESESESEADAESPRKYPFGYGYQPGVTTRRHHGHVVEVPVAMTPRRQRVPSDLIEDPLAQKFDCNYYDCTKADNAAVSPVGSLNPVEPYVNVQEPRTTTFSTVPDLLQQKAHTEVTITV